MDEAQSPPPAGGLRLNNIALAVENLDRMATWYETVLDFEVVERGRVDKAGTDYAMLEGAGFRLELVSLPGAPRRPAEDAGTTGHFAALGWQAVVLRTGNLSATTAALIAHNVDIVWAESQLSSTLSSTMIRDPEGNLINIFGMPEPN